jgi:rare lipoprotein A (peptidoglycan hydrolase)
MKKFFLFLFAFNFLTQGCGIQGYQTRPVYASDGRSEIIQLGRWQFRKADTVFGKASFYGKKFHGRKTANGEIYNMHRMTAAHRTLPFGTLVQVTNLKNNKSVIVRINDRGPFIPGRMIDLSYAAAQRLDFINDGVVKVKVEKLKLLSSN